MRLWNDFGVRALLATIVVVATVYVLVRQANDGSEYATVTLVSMAAGVMGAYFYQKRKPGESGKC